MCLRRSDALEAGGETPNFKRQTSEKLQASIFKTAERMMDANQEMVLISCARRQTAEAVHCVSLCVQPRTEVRGQWEGCLWDYVFYKLFGS